MNEHEQLLKIFVAAVAHMRGIQKGDTFTALPVSTQWKILKDAEQEVDEQIRLLQLPARPTAPREGGAS